MAKPLFVFNLLSKKKGVKQIEKEEKRTSGLLYAAFFLFVGVILWVAVSGFNLVVVRSSLADWEQAEINKNAEVASFTSYKVKNGELVTKTGMLSEVVLKHTDPELVFDIIESRIIETAPNVEVLSYGREPSGHFQVTCSTTQTVDIPRLLKAFPTDENVEDVSLTYMQKDEDGSYEFMLDLEIIDGNETEQSV